MQSGCLKNKNNTVILDNSLLQSDDTRGCIYTITT